MAELQIDQSNLPCVQEVCQSFAVLEDGVLAHNLQEQEIEQYYCSNVQKNQLVQNDIRVAKRLQDEEERRCRALLRQESRQLEEDDDFEYARLIQEEIRRRAREVRRRERDDQEMAEQMQEEEELMMRRAREEEHHRGGSSGAFMPPLPSQHQHALSGRSPAQALYSPTTSWWHYSNTRNPPEHSRPPPPPDYPGRAFASESLHAHSDGFEQRANQRRDPAPPPPLHRRLSLRLPGERHGRGTPGSVAEEEYYGRADGEERQREVDRRVENGPPRAGQDGAAGAAEAGERRRRRSQSVRIHHRPRRGSGDSSGTHGYRDNADKRVRFATDGGSSCRGRPPDAGVPRLWEMLGHVLRERGVPVSVGGRGAPLKISPQSPAGRPLGPSHPPHGTPFLRAASARHSFHGDLRERRSSSRRDVGERERGLDGHFSHIGGGGAGNGWARHDGGRACHDGGRGLADVHEDPPERIADGRPTAAEEAFGSDEEAGGQRGAQRSFPRRTGSWLGWRRSAAGASLPPKKKQTSLDLGDLQQVLCDEELARKLHEQENNLLARTSRRPSRGRYPEGDFRVAQVAQDEEIAHYMQKQEMESNRMSRQLEEPTSRGEHRHHRSTTPDRQVEWEGLPSPVALTSPVSTLRQSPPVQNIAEELDPTFRAKRQGADILQTEQSGSLHPIRSSETIGGQTLTSFSPKAGGACQWLPGPRRLLEEPAFIPPTKRQKDKAKEKKEKCKQQ